MFHQCQLKLSTGQLFLIWSFNRQLVEFSKRAITVNCFGIGLIMNKTKILNKDNDSGNSY